MNRLDQLKITSDRLWEVLFDVTMPFLETKTKEHLERFGVVVTGIKAIDSSINSEYVDVMINIDKMVEYHRNGVHFFIPKDDDVKTIYQYIVDHLEVWRDMLYKGVNNLDAPIEDLIAMDELANALFSLTSHNYKEELNKNSVLSGINTKQPIGPSNFFKPGVKLRSNKEHTSVNNTGIVRINSEKNDEIKREEFSHFLKDKYNERN